jgi:hypothetical protein
MLYLRLSFVCKSLIKYLITQMIVREGLLCVGPVTPVTYISIQKRTYRINYPWQGKAESMKTENYYCLNFFIHSHINALIHSVGERNNWNTYSPLWPVTHHNMTSQILWIAQIFDRLRYSMTDVIWLSITCSDARVRRFLLTLIGDSLRLLRTIIAWWSIIVSK